MKPEIRDQLLSFTSLLQTHTAAWLLVTMAPSLTVDPVWGLAKDAADNLEFLEKQLMLECAA